MPDSLSALERTLESIRNFEYARERLEKRRTAEPDALGQIDRSIALNQKTLDALNHRAAEIQQQLARNRSRR